MPAGAAARYVRLSAAGSAGGRRGRGRGARPRLGLRPGAAAGRRRGLFAYPAQSNFSGVQHPLGWVRLAQAAGYDVLLDAAAFVPANRLDLARSSPSS